ncbi:reverse transcriptase domain-containing protein, partial [Dechloromonas sp.]|uniref:reverse transcriptase domain-containing protein n=1 Tax=Dechloromonas sp. TaxID=1917218 RepID=UPI002172A1C3
MREAMRQMPEKSGRVPVVSGEAARASTRDEATRPRHETGSTGSALLMAALTRENLQQAWKRVKANKGAAGVDGRDIPETARHLQTAWPEIRAQLVQGTYRPSPVRRVTIPKPDGGERELGIPTVTDRLIQQALLQVLQPMLDPTFSEYSFGFRPGRSAQEAVVRAQAYVQSGCRIVVDVDLEKFFDRVNHDILIGRLQKRIGDACIIRLIRAYLNSGILQDGMVQTRYQYAKLHLLVNETKSAVASAFGRKFLGFSFWVSSKGEIKCKVAAKPMAAYRRRIRQLTRRSGGRSMAEVLEGLRPYVPGWKAYFRLSQTPRVWRTLDEWMRHRLRAIQLKHWKRGTTMYRELKVLGASETVARRVAGNARSYWRNA